MENYPKYFIKAGLIYLALGVLLGVSIGVKPTLAPTHRFIHIHLNLLGFMTMFIAGVAYHVLPRFSARPIPWPAGVKYHFYLQNIGLIGMVTTHSFGAMWKGGALQVGFVAFSTAAAVGLFFMVYNLYFVLTPPKTTEKPETITGDMKVAAVLEHFPQAMPIFLKAGFNALANPAARNTFARMVSVDKACEKHGVNAAEFVRQLNVQLIGKEGATEAKAPPAAKNEEKKSNPAEGHIIQKGEACEPDTLVGSLIRIYPDTKAVFEKHYGEGCFSCPGQAFETVEQTAHMHNVDVSLILSEINSTITGEPGEPPGAIR